MSVNKIYEYRNIISPLRRGNEIIFNLSALTCDTI